VDSIFIVARVRFLKDRHGPRRRAELPARPWVEVGEIRHKTPIGAWDGGFALGLDPARGDYASFANFSDPDGNSWVLQERGYRNE